MSLKDIIDGSDTRAAKLFDWVIEFLILVSLISFSVETLPQISEELRRFLTRLEVIIVIIFTIEYLLRIAIAESKLKFIFSFYGMIDLLAIAPFYLARGIDLRSVRVFRILRIVRVLKILRFSRAVLRFHRAFKEVKAELILFLMATLFLLYVSAVGIYYFENPAQPKQFASVFHSLWWAVATLTTVGYGDIYPITVGGRIFTFAVLMIGLGLVAVPAGLIASAMTATIAEEKRLHSHKRSKDKWGGTP